MTLSFAPYVEQALAEQARQRGRTPESLVEEAVLEKLDLAPDGIKDYDLTPRDDWERRILGIGVHTGVSLTDEQLSREVMYEAHD